MSGLRRRAAARSLIGAALACVAVLLALPTAAGGNAQDKDVYIVQMIQSPAAGYAGGISGYAATKPAKGQKLDPAAQAVVKYTGYLKNRHNATLARVGGGQKLYDYVYSYNGFAARLTDGQAAALKKQADVLAVSPDRLVEADTSSTPKFLGLDASAGLWSQLGGPAANKKGSGAGENIIIGIVDSGIWPESKSFSDRDAAGKLAYQPLSIATWHGKKCDLGEAWDTEDCNKKLIGARYFNQSWGGSAALEAERPWEFQSARDYSGHGSHTASTAGGNHNTPTTGPAAVFGPVSGMAPRARIAAYKALWSTQDASTSSGFTGDLVAAIDQAVADGVDVINYSISGSRTNFADPVMISFLFAADAGVFVSTSAGNSGPPTGTVAHPGPWVTTVAAGTHNRNGIGSVTLGNGTTYNGASVAGAVGPAPFIDSMDAGVAGADPTELALCFSKTDNEGVAVLDPAKVAGKIVLCDRGVNARVNKSLAVQEAGGVGMVLVNTSTSSINADFHFVPTVHVSGGCVQTSPGPPPVFDCPDRSALKAYTATAGATARINQSAITLSDPAPFTASFSSRGPLTAGGGDLLKPDVIAPGQDILAAVAPPGNAGRDFNLYSGTSMSAPHVAGLGALLKHRHPSWSPMAIKSALMTSGGDVLDGPNTNPLVIFRQGAGHVRPNNAADPGLVFDSGFNDWVAMLCGSTNAVSPAFCNALKAQGYSFDVSDMNVASVAIGDMAGDQTVTRRVTNVGGNNATYTPTVSGLSGITASFDPAEISIAPGQTKTIRMTFARTSAALNAYTGGQITFSDGAGDHTVRIPVVIRPVGIAAPSELTLSGTSGSTSYGIKTGYNGPLAYTKRGLIPSQVFTGTVPDGKQEDFDTGNPMGNSAFVTHNIATSADTSLLRISMFDAETSGADDIDLYLYRVDPDGSDTGTDPDLVLVGASTGGTSAEQIQLTPTPTSPLDNRTFRLFVHGWDTEHPTADYSVHSWALGTSDAGNWTVTGPATASIGATGTVNLSWTGLQAGKRYLGQVRYDQIGPTSTTTHGTTIVRIDG